MTAIRKQGRINENTTLIDYGLFGIACAGALYLIEGEKKCVIDGGTRSEAQRIYRILKNLDAFPPDIIILSHSHWDHTQSVPFLRKKASQQKKSIEVMASERALPLLEDQSWNGILSKGPFENIKDVTPLKEGDNVDLGGITLKIFDVPGHAKDHIAILDERSKNIFVGDAIGVKTGDQFFIPPFQPPYWDRDAFYNTVNKLREIDYKSLCLAHFGYIYGDEAKSILDDAISVYELWWELFERNADRLDDIDFLLELVSRETNLVYPEFTVVDTKLKVLSALLTGWSKLTRKKPKPAGELVMPQVLGGLVRGYRAYKNL